MSGRALTRAERDWLDYLKEIGFDDLYLGARRTAPAEDPAPKPAAPQRVAAKPTPSRGESGIAAGSELTPVATEPEGAPSPESLPSDLSALAELAGGCTACKLSEGRNSVVFGSGNPAADLMFIGEGPGAEEDRQGLPFVGPAGNLLTKIIGAIELGREDVYIANVVKCRPPRNRDPEAEEVAACRGYLEKQIELVAPKVIVALGRVAAQTLLGLNSPLGRMRGSWHAVCGIPTRVTYHPAALLRNESYKRPTWEDMQIVRDRLAESP